MTRTMRGCSSWTSVWYSRSNIARSVGAQLLRADQLLERDLLARALVDDTIDTRHAAVAELGFDLVASAHSRRGLALHHIGLLIG